jgi:Tfp pilus assembly protein PilW
VKELLRYKNILLSIIIIVVFIFVIKGLWTSHSLVIADLRTKTSDLEKGKLLIEKWYEVSTEYDKLKENFSMKDEAAFKKFLEEKTKSYGINVTYLSPIRKQEDFYSEMSFNIRATSESYATIVNFLNALEEKKVIVETLKVRGAEDKNKSTDITVKSFIIEQ